MINDQQLMMYLRKKLDNYRSYRSENSESEQIEALRLYSNYRENQTNLWQTNIFLPYVFAMIETVLPRLAGYIWQGDKLVEAHPRYREDAVHADVVDNLLQYQIDTRIENLFLEMIELMKCFLIYGNGIGKLWWDVQKDTAQFRNLDILDFYPQPHKKYIDQMDGVFEVFDQPVDELYQMQQQGFQYQNIEKLIHTSKQAKGEEAHIKKSGETGKIENYEPSRPTALIYQYWGKIPVQESMEIGNGYSTSTFKEAHIEIGNREFIIKNRKNQQGVPENPYFSPGDPDGFRPYIDAKNYLMPGEFWAKGDVTPVKDLQYEANEHENSMMDNVKLLMNRMWMVDPNAGVNYSHLVSYPGNIVVGEIDKFKPIDHKDMPQSVFSQQDRFPQQIDRASGVFDYSKGGNAPGMTDTVGGISALIEEANMRFSFKIEMVQMTAIKQFAEKLFKLDKIFMKGAEIPVRLQGGKGMEWMTINPDNISGLYDIKPIPVSMLGNKLAQQNGLIKLLEVVSKAAPIPGLVGSILEKFEVPNKDEVLFELHRMWGIPPPGAPPPGAVPPQGPAGGGGPAFSSQVPPPTALPQAVAR